jgi:hypothetical protein
VFARKSYKGVRLKRGKGENSTEARLALNVRDFKRARQLFDNIPQPDSTTSSILISSLTTHALPNVAINIYASLRARGIKPVSSVSLVMPSG